MFFIFRFCEEFSVFDEMEILESILEVLELYFKKFYFNGDYFEKKINNVVVGFLLFWVKGVFR